MTNSEVGGPIAFNAVASAFELNYITTTTSALFWHETGNPKPRNGSTSFLNLGEKTFAVTAAHVIEGFKESSANIGASVLRVAGERGALDLADIDTRLIALDSKMDIATFRISDDEVRGLGKTVLNVLSEHWPPPTLHRQQGLILSGYPGAGTRVDPRFTTFGAAPAQLAITSLSDTNIDCQIERDKITGLLGKGVPPENFDFGGISGAAMFARVQSQSGVMFWMFAGVVIQGPNTDVDPNMSIAGFELIRGRRSHFINADGTLNRELWAYANVFR